MFIAAHILKDHLGELVIGQGFLDRLDGLVEIVNALH
jgi:hypothetical protein